MINMVITCDKCGEANFRYTSMDGTFIMPVGWYRFVPNSGSTKVICPECIKPLGYI